MHDRFLPGVPSKQIEEIYNRVGFDPVESDRQYS